MASYGYARVSTTDQDLAVQKAALRAAGCEMIRAEKKSGTTTAGRSELQTLIDFVRKGDVIVVTRIDRLARSLKQLIETAGLKAGQPRTMAAASKCSKSLPIRPGRQREQSPRRGDKAADLPFEQPTRLHVSTKGFVVSRVTSPQTLSAPA